VSGGGAARINGASVLLDGIVDIAQLELQGGALGTLGSGTLQGSLINNGGRLLPGGIGKLRITGSFTQSAGGTLAINLGASATCSAFDQLQIGGAANLGGTLRIERVDGCNPSAGQRFPIMMFGSRTGDFAQVLGLGADLRREDAPTSIDLVRT
jgi:hypothetical protein